MSDALLVPIGEFSKMTYLTVKALRHYHDVGLLVPADIDTSSGYRRYGLDQVRDAQTIRRLRALEMPLDDIGVVLRDPSSRDAVISAHLDRMTAQLERTQTSIDALRSLLTPSTRADVDVRVLPSLRVACVRETAEWDDVSDWFGPTFEALHALVGPHVAGVDGALYAESFFADGVGEVVAFVPVDDVYAGDSEVLPATTVAVLRHDGPFDELDQTYGALGTVVHTRGIGLSGPIREHYLDDSSTDVCWPVRSSISHA